jgi:type I restriction enzyme S subunit
MSDWEEVSLADLCESITYGYTTSADAQADGPKFLRITDIASGRIDWNVVPRCVIDPKDFAKYQLFEGDIVVARTGASSGANCMFAGDIEAVFASFLVRLRINRRLAEPAFIAAALQSPSWWAHVENSLGGSAQPQFNAKSMGAFRLALPPLPQQRRIAGVLGALREKADHNRLISRDLRRVIGGECVKLLADAQDARSLSSVADFINGRAFTKDADGSGRPILRIKELNGGIADNTLWSSISAEDKNVAHPFDLLFSWSGSLNVYRWDGPESLINQHIFKVIPSADWPVWLVEHWLKLCLASFQAIAAGKATTMGHIQRRDLDEAMVVVPSAEKLAEVRGRVDLMDELQTRLIGEANELDQIWLRLLPALVGGGLSVAESYRSSADGAKTDEEKAA